MTSTRLTVLIWAIAYLKRLAPLRSLNLFICSAFLGITPLLLFITFKMLLVSNLLPDPGIESAIVSGTGNELVSDPALSTSTNRWIKILFLIILIQSLAFLLQRKLTADLRSQADSTVTTSILEKASRVSLALFEQKMCLDELHRLKGHVSHRLVELIRRFATLLTACLQLLTLVLFLSIIQPILLGFLLLTFMPYLILQFRQSSRHVGSEQRLTTTRRRIEHYVSLMTSTHSAAEIRQYNLKNIIISRFHQAVSTINKHYAQQDNKTFRLEFIYTMLTLAGLYFLTQWLVDSTTVSSTATAELVIFVIGVVRLRTSQEQFSSSMNAMQVEIEHVTALKHFLERPEDIPSASSNANFHFDGHVVLSQVSFRYPDTSLPVLEDVSVEIHSGEVVVVLGKNSSGKSTLAKLIGGIYDQYEGAIAYSGINLKQLAAKQKTGTVAFVFQDSTRFASSAHDLIAFGNWNTLQHDSSSVEFIAQQLRLSDTINAMPMGYDTQLGRKFGDLDPSGGTWQKFSLARAIASDAPLLILDEPTANLDQESANAVFELIKSMKDKRTVILISHQLSTVDFADRVIIMDNGRIQATGTPEALAAIPGIYDSFANSVVDDNNQGTGQTK